MQLRTFVKISEVNNLSDARYCAGMGVNLLGFNIDPNSSQSIAPDRYKEIIDWVAGVKLVGEFDQSSAEEVGEHLQQYPVDVIQCNKEENLQGFHKLGKPVIFRIDVSEIDSAEELQQLMERNKGVAEFFLLENKDEDYRISLEKEIFALARQYPIVLGFSITEDNVIDLLDEYPFKGIALKGGDEIKPGYKDFDELADILEQLESDDFI
jgi:phosphoribosylanthranilate isomerase